MAGKILLLPPMKGFADAQAYGEMIPFTSPAVRNVLLTDGATGRFRPAQRPGTGPVDYFDFNTGHTRSAGTLTLVVGTDTGDGATGAINIPADGCFTVSSTSPHLDLIMVGAGATTNTANCSSGTLVVIEPPGTHDTGGGSTGVVTVDYGGGIDPAGPGDPSVVIPACATFIGGCGDTSDNDERPWLKLHKCSDGSDAGWIDQEITGDFGHLPVLYDNRTGATYHLCLQVTAQRQERSITPANVRVRADFTVFESCAECLTPSKRGYYLYTLAYNCDTGVWGTRSAFAKRCVLSSSISYPNQWRFDGSTTTTSRTYNYYLSTGLSCTTTGDVDSDGPEAADIADLDAATATLRASPPATCGGSVLYVNHYNEGDVAPLFTDTFTVSADDANTYTDGEYASGGGSAGDGGSETYTLQLARQGGGAVFLLTYPGGGTFTLFGRESDEGIPLGRWEGDDTSVYLGQGNYITVGTTPP